MTYFIKHRETIIVSTYEIYIYCVAHETYILTER